MYKERKSKDFSFTPAFLFYLISQYIWSVATVAMMITALVLAVHTYHTVQKSYAIEKENLLAQIATLVDEQGNLIASELLMALGFSSGGAKRSEPALVPRSTSDTCRTISDQQTCSQARSLCNSLSDCVSTRDVATCQRVAIEATSMCRLIN